MKRLLGLTILLLYALGAVFPQQIWTGNALQSGSSDFTAQGMFAASNAFPIGTMVDVTNPLSGETVRVEITSRLRDPGLFLLLSSSAAQRIGVDGRYPSVVQAEPIPTASRTAGVQGTDEPFSDDPDLNPAASAGDPNSFLFDDSPIPELAVAPSPEPDVQEDSNAQVQEPVSDEPDSVAALPQDRPAQPEPRAESPEQTVAPEQTTPTPRETPAQDPFDVAVDNSLLLAEVQQDQTPEEPQLPESGPGPLSAPEETGTIEESDPVLATPPVDSQLADVPDTGAEPEPEPEAAPEPEQQPEPTDTLPKSPSPASRGIRSALQQFGPPKVNTPSLLGQVLSTPVAIEDPAEVPNIAEVEEDSDEEIASPYTLPMLGDPSEQALEDYYRQFGGAPSAQGALLADRGELSLLRQHPPQDTPAALAGIPQPETRFARVEVSPGRLEPQIADRSTLPSLPLASYAGEAETYEDLFPRLASPRTEVPHMSNLPEAQTDERELPENPQPRLTSPGGIEKGISDTVPAPRVASPEIPDSPLPRAAAPETGKYIITLVPAEFKPPQVDAPESGIYASAGSTPTNGSDLAVPGAQDPESGLYASSNEGLGDVTLQEPTRIDPETGLYSEAGTEGNPAVALKEPDPKDTPEEGDTTPDDTVEPPLLAEAGEGEPIEGVSTLPTDPESPESLDPLRPQPERDPMVADLNEPTTKDPGAEPAEEPSEPVMETADDLLVFLEPVDQEGPETTEAEGPETTEPETEVANIQTPATEPAKTTGEKETTEAILAQLPIVTRLQPESYYLQVGAFANPESARSAVFAISPGYPIAVEPVKSGDRQLYRLYVGPLTEDEKGTVLYWFKAKGYRDAFIRQGI